MDVKFSSQLGYNNLSFGLYKRIKINNSNPLNLAYIIRDLEFFNTHETGRCCFQLDGIPPIPIKYEGSVMSIVSEYFTKPEVNIYANGAFPRKLFNVMKKCLQASSIDEATRIAKINMKKFSKIG